MVTRPDDPHPLPGPARMIVRGATRRCPRCGGRRLFTNWLKMKPRCPRCGLKFEREEGFFLGAYVVNFGAMLVSLAVFITVAIAATLPDPPAVRLAVAGMVVGTVVPIAFYPMSRTIWSAIDLIMKPLEPDEIIDAERAAPTAPRG